MASRLSRPPVASTPLPRARPWPLVAWMLVAIALVTGLAFWDEQREAEDALRDLLAEQAVLATSLAGGLRARLAVLQLDAARAAERGPGVLGGRYDSVRVRDAGAAPSALGAGRLVVSVPVDGDRFVDLGVSVADLVDGERRLARGGALQVLVAAPATTTLFGLDGRAMTSTPLRDALDHTAGEARLTREQSAEVGLPARTSVAGLAYVDAGALGTWGVVTVSSAARERDREKHAQWRLALGVLLASGLVLLFGGAALRKQRKELELSRELAVAEAQRQRDEELLRAGRMATMGTFAMGIAHELSTPLAVIVGRAEQLLARARDDERAGRSAQTILQQADRIQHIVKRFLDMARGGPPALDRVDPAQVVGAATRAVEHRFTKAHVALMTDLPAGMPAIQCDRDLLEQAIVNLLLNACDACDAGGRVEVTARADAEQVAFVVTDDGEGIRPEDAARATQPFFTTKSAGSGLGLAIATEIVKSHRGELTIAPNAGRGTRARIEIPIAGGGSDAHAA